MFESIKKFPVVKYLLPGVKLKLPIAAAGLQLQVGQIHRVLPRLGSLQHGGKGSMVVSGGQGCGAVY